MGYRIGIDVGGTFTDFVLARPDGSISFTKTASTPSDQSDGVMRGIADLAEAEGLDPRACSDAPIRSCTGPPPATTSSSR